MSITEKIRYYAKKEVKKPRWGVDNSEIFNIEELRRLGEEYVSGLEGKKILLLGEKKRLVRQKGAVYFSIITVCCIKITVSVC